MRQLRDFLIPIGVYRDWMYGAQFHQEHIVAEFMFSNKAYFMGFLAMLFIHGEGREQARH
jgi:hypothetical protein